MHKINVEILDHKIQLEEGRKNVQVLKRELETGRREVEEEDQKGQQSKQEKLKSLEAKIEALEKKTKKTQQDIAWEKLTLKEKMRVTEEGASATEEACNIF